MKFPIIKLHFKSLIILLTLGLPIVLAGIVTLSFPSLAAPTKPVPGLNIQENQMLTNNVSIKLQRALVSMFQTGTGQGTLELSEAEINALVAQSLSRNLPNDLHFIGCSSRVQGDRIYIVMAVTWRGFLLGPELLLKPKVTTAGNLSLEIEDSRLGRLPLPPSLLEHYLASNLPCGCKLTRNPLLLVFDPDSLINQVNLPLIKDPSLKITHLGLQSHKLQLTAQLTFRLQFLKK